MIGQMRSPVCPTNEGETKHIQSSLRLLHVRFQSLIGMSVILYVYFNPAADVIQEKGTSAHNGMGTQTQTCTPIRAKQIKGMIYLSPRVNK